jgi:hypothetical protein
MNYRSILDQVGEATLVVVTKNHSIDEIMQVYNEGCRDFGENRLQEALPKIEALPKDIRWHFIGSLQRNKVNKVVENFSFIHSIDSLPLAEKIAATGKKIPCFLEVNTSGETSKHGFTIEECEKLPKMEGIEIVGLMTMAPLTDDKRVIRSCFSKLRLLKEKLGLKFLSMGMSHDWRIALEEGATHLRIGSAIFDFIGKKG